MKWYHTCSKEDWEKTKKRGYLLNKRGKSSPCTYLAVIPEDAKGYGPVLLEVRYDPRVNPDKNNYDPESWQIRVYEPIYEFKQYIAPKSTTC